MTYKYQGKRGKRRITVRINISKAYIFAVLLCLSDFLGFYKFLPLGSSLYKWDLIYAYILIFSIIFILLKAGKENVSFWTKKIKYSIIGLMVLTLIEILLSSLNYKQSAFMLMKEASYNIVFAVMLYSFSIINFSFITKEWLCKKIVLFSVLSSFSAILFFVLYSAFSFNPLQLSENVTRNGTIRFGIGTGIVILALIISFTKFLNKSATKLDVINILLGTIQIYYVNKTRSIILFLIILFCIIILKTKRTNNLLKISLFLLISVSVILVFFGNQYFAAYINDYVNNDYGLLNRSEAIVFYLNQFIHKPMFGMGYIGTDRSSVTSLLLYGPNGNYYRGDLGVIGLIDEYGIAGLIWTLYFLYGIYCMGKNTTIYAQIIRFVVFYYVISLVNLSFMDSERLLFVGITILLGFIVENQKKGEIYDS